MTNHTAPQAPSSRPVWEGRRLSPRIVAWAIGVYALTLAVIGYVTFQLLMGNL